MSRKEMLIAAVAAAILSSSSFGLVHAGAMGDFEKELNKKLIKSNIDKKIYKHLFKTNMPAHARLVKTTAKGNLVGTSIKYQLPDGGLPLNPKLGDAQTIENCDFEPVVSSVTLGTEVTNEANWEKEKSKANEFEQTLEVEVNYCRQTRPAELAAALRAG